MAVAQAVGPVLRVDGLVKDYGPVRAVDSMAFSIMPGQIYGLLGPNGAGKTTTIKCVLGLLEVQAGSISVLGEDPAGAPERVKVNIGYVADDPMLYGSITPREMLDFVASVRGLDPAAATERARELITALDATRYYDSLMATLSRGNKQKFQIVSAMLHEPRLLILDEPLSGLDARTGRVVKGLLRLHAERGGAVLLSTHIMEQAQTLCDRIGVINRGRMVAEGSLEQLRALQHSADATLEELFLKLTEQDEDVRDSIDRLRQDMNGR